MKVARLLLATIVAAIPAFARPANGQTPTSGSSESVKPAPVSGEEETSATTRPSRSPDRDESFAILLRDVAKAHRSEAAKDDVFDRFVGEISILPLGRDVERIEVRLLAQFLSPRLLRYEVKEQGKRLERGVDERGPWARTDGEPYSLGGRDFQKDRESLRQHVRLAKLLLSFLDPAAILESLENRSKVSEQTLAVGRGQPEGPFRYVRGDYTSFPFFREEGGSARARLEAWIDDAGVLQAVRATPIHTDSDTDDPLSTVPGSEMIRFAAYREHDGVQIPTQLTVFDVGEAPRQPAQGAKIAISRLELRPDLTEASFVRPK